MRILLRGLVMLNFKRFLAPKVQTRARAQARAFFLDGAAKKTSSVFPTLEFFCEILKIRFRLRNNWSERLVVKLVDSVTSRHGAQIDQEEL